MEESPSLHERFSHDYETYVDAIVRHCLFRIGDAELAKEFAQETFIRTWKYLADGNVVENMKAFLYRTANHIIIDDARRRKLRTVTSLETLMEQGFDVSTDVDEESAMQQKIDIKLILALLPLVKQPYRDVLVMRFIDCLSPSEIAAVTGESENVISVRINRGIKKLRSLLEKQ